ncbi:MAG: outer membrane protein transport protein [Hyphomicrobiaceae bacterium]|nr:outer membrane protein transport protein [Hyphomicrobiaceae bacterium]
MINRSIKTVLCAAASLGALAVASMPAEAGGFALREQSTVGQGMSFAGVAAGGALSSMFWNPATLGAVQGIQSEQNFTLIVPITEVTAYSVLAPTTPIDQGDIGLDALVPSGYNAIRWGDFVFGLSTNGPFGLATKMPMTSPLRTLGIAGTSEVFSLNATPTVSYDVTDWLTIGAGLQIQYFDVRYTAANLGALGVSSLAGDDIGFGFTLGVLLRPMDGTEIGVGFRSSVRHDIDGRLLSPVLGNAPASLTLETPEVVTVGIRQRVTDTFTIAAGLEWANWSRLGSPNVAVNGGAINFQLPFEYEDSWFFSLGGEYAYSEALTLRAGVGYELSPISDDVRTFRLPDDDRLWLSAGASYRATDAITVDLGYSFLTTFDTEISRSAAFGGTGPTPNGPFSGEADANVHILSLGVRIALGGPDHGGADGNVYKP